jgi:3-deoxy-D-manno-octulosonate 8-phosphate phosphatase (KDO 8-P phosphatase)
MNIDKFNQLAKDIKLLILDVDGVLTDGGLYFADSGEEFKRFNSLDGHGIKEAMRSGIEIAIITARDNSSLQHRVKNLGIKYYYTGRKDKLNAFTELLAQLNLQNNEIAYIGDDVLDLPVMLKVGLPVAVANAHLEVQNRAVYTTNNTGGNGAVREVVDMLFKAQNKYDTIIARYINEK